MLQIESDFKDNTNSADDASKTSDDVEASIKTLVGDNANKDDFDDDDDDDSGMPQVNTTLYYTLLYNTILYVLHEYLTVCKSKTQLIGVATYTV
jgi:hypothetical protein